MKPTIITLAIFLCYGITTRAQEKLVVHFDFNKSEINSDAKQILDSMITANKNLFVITGVDIAAHCDSVGNNRYNDSLSNERAKSVKDYLIQQGIAPSAFTKLVSPTN